jgi:glucosamine--fructose-6-phosphate aminotransferase (isomerizing)
MFMPTDEAAHGMRELAISLREKATALLTTEPGAAGAGRLPAVDSDHPETDAVCLIQSFYAMLIRLAERLGTDVDRPRYLRKVTRTR